MRILNLPSGNRVSIYNRFGDEVFEMNNYDSDAAGKRFEGYNKNGRDLPTGIYFYKIEVGNEKVLTGYLSLIQYDSH
jgi:gliding motility-associated-like protein